MPTKMKLAFVTVLAIASFTSNPVRQWTHLSSQVIANQPVPAPTNGTPDPENNRTAGGTRGGGCKQTDEETSQPFTALVPIKSSQSLTTAEHPIFWFYIPDVPDEVQSIEFSLHPWDGDEKGTLYRTSVQLTKTSGVIGIPLPSSPKHSLKLDEIYHWRFIVTCVQKESSSDPLILELDGWVTRVEPGSNLALWYDELTNLAQRYLSEPESSEVKRAWIDLLKSVGLEGMAQEPVVGVVGNSEDN